MGTKRGFWLLQKVLSDKFFGAWLPSKKQVLLLFIYHHKEKKETLLNAAESTRANLKEV